MTKRLVEIDDDVLEQAMRELKTESIRSTVNEALKSVVRRGRQFRALADIERRDLLGDLNDPRVKAGARR